jgi:hypothetical protein
VNDADAVRARQRQDERTGHAAAAAWSDDGRFSGLGRLVAAAPLASDHAPFLLGKTAPDT